VIGATKEKYKYVFLEKKQTEESSS